MDINNNRFFSHETISEITGDLLCFEIILEIKRRMKNEEAKSYIASFLKILAPVYVHELANAFDKVGLLSKDKLLSLDDKKRVNYERQLAVHKTIVSSSNAQRVISEMGIDFNKKIYDINIIVRNSELYDLNFECEISPLNDLDFWNFLFNIPKTLLTGIFSSIESNFNIEGFYNRKSRILDFYAHRLDKTLALSRYSYSAHKLFQNSDSLEETDKILILYRYRMITSLKIISENLPSMHATIRSGIEIDIASFFRKYRALLICILGDELRATNTPFSNRIMADLQKGITDNRFYALNRKLRNNLHYKKTEILSQDELDIVAQNQSIYFDILERHINASINIDIDKECIRMTGFSQAYRASAISWEELNRNYYFYYIKYLITGKL